MQLVVRHQRHFIEEAGRFYHYGYIHAEVAKETMATLQASWDALAESLKTAKATLRELLSEEEPDEETISKLHKRIEAIQEKQQSCSEHDRDLIINFEASPADCRISHREPRRLES